MKVSGHGQAKVLSVWEIDRLFNEGFSEERDRALFGICLYTGCRISEAVVLKLSDIGDGLITFRKANTKGKTGTRQVPIAAGLRSYLDGYQSLSSVFLFPGAVGGIVTKNRPLTRFAADKCLRTAAKRVGLVGVSTHSFRRTALTMMHQRGIPLRHIQAISGHQSLAALQRYLDLPSDVEKAAAVEAIGDHGSTASRYPEQLRQTAQQGKD
ncbi:site-specific integrase [bacterium]|nr:site-specific integrase [bacterium]